MNEVVLSLAVLLAAAAGFGVGFLFAKRSASSESAAPEQAEDNSHTELASYSADVESHFAALAALWQENALLQRKLQETLEQGAQQLLDNESLKQAIAQPLPEEVIALHDASTAPPRDYAGQPSGLLSGRSA